MGDSNVGIVMKFPEEHVMQVTDEELEVLERFRKEKQYRKGMARGFHVAAAKLEEIAKTGGGGEGIVDGTTSMYIQAILRLNPNDYEM